MNLTLHEIRVKGIFIGKKAKGSLDLQKFAKGDLRLNSTFSTLVVTCLLHLKICVAKKFAILLCMM